MSQENGSADTTTNDATPEGPQGFRDHALAALSAVYLLVALAFLAWQLFDIWGEQYLFLQRFLLRDIFRVSANNTVAADKLADGVFRTMAYAAIGGGMGGAVNGGRSLINRYADRTSAKQFYRRFTYAYLFLPPLGATRGLVIIALMRTGLGVINGETAVSTGTGPSLSSFALGFLAGYGSGTVFVWLDSRVSAIFRPTTILLPSVIGKSRVDAELALIAVQVSTSVNMRPARKDEIPNVVLEQEPRPFSMVAQGSRVTVTIAEPPPPPTPAKTDGT